MQVLEHGDVVAEPLDLALQRLDLPGRDRRLFRLAEIAVELFADVGDMVGVERVLLRRRILGDASIVPTVTVVNEVIVLQQILLQQLTDDDGLLSGSKDSHFRLHCAWGPRTGTFRVDCCGVLPRWLKLSRPLKAPPGLCCGRSPPTISTIP